MSIRRTSENHPPVMYYADGSGYPGHAGGFEADYIDTDGAWRVFDGSAWTEDQAHEVLEEEGLYECEGCGEVCEPAVREVAPKYAASYCRQCVDKEPARFIRMTTEEDEDADGTNAIRWCSVAVLREVIGYTALRALVGPNGLNVAALPAARVAIARVEG